MSSYRNSDNIPPIMQGSPPAMPVPKAAWDMPPWNRWAFQHVREMVPTVEVWRGEGPVRALPRAETDLDHLAVTDSEGRATTLSSLLDETYTDGFLVLKDGKIAYERYFNGMTPRTPHLSQSVAKSVTGSVFGILAGRGIVDPSKLVTDYLPELAATGWNGATVQHVLDMTTGVRFSEAYTDPYSDIGQVDVACGWKPVPEQTDPGFQWPKHVFELIQRLTGTTRAHGAAFEYRSIETDVLAFIMERATGKRLAQLVSEELWQKIGAEESAYFTVDSAGYALADGGFNATLRDFARFALLLLNGGKAHGRQIVPKEWIESFNKADHDVFGDERQGALPNGAYHNQFWIEAPDSPVFMCFGIFGQYLYMDPKAEFAMIKLSTDAEPVSEDRTFDMLAAAHALRDFCAKA